MGSLFEEHGGEERQSHPFDIVIGQKVNSLIQQNTGGNTIGLTFAEFKEIKWPYKLPYFICDMIQIISGFSMI